MLIPKVSVIVPVYNASAYISRCCESLFMQTLQDIEYVFVDDCSTDNSVELIERQISRFPERITGVRIIRNVENKGVSYSRQKGLDCASGEFVIHCDADDWIDCCAYEKMYNEAVQKNAQVVCCGYYVEYGNQCTKENYPVGYKLENFSISPLVGAVWNKLIKLDLIKEKNLSFPEKINWGEDLCFALPAQLFSEKVAYLNDCFYHYCQNDNSITHSYKYEKCLELVGCGKFVEESLQRNSLKLQDEFQLNYLKFQLKQYFLISKECRNVDKWLEYYPECNEYIFRYQMPLYIRVSSWLIVQRSKRIARFVLFCKDIYSRYIGN